MLHLIPPALHRRLYRLADWGRRQWWKVRKPQRRSVLVLAHDGEGRVLLVLHSYGPRLWALPGGGLGRSEDPEAAAGREMAEEVGCAITDLRPLEVADETESGSADRQFVFVARLVGTPVPDEREIVAVRLAAPDALPAGTGRIAARRIALWASQQR